jgi:3-oxoacyl-[acyl-carrier protein] reductase
MQTIHLLITGASRGIGLETAKALIDKRYNVTVTARSADLLANLKKESPDLVDPIAADLSNPADIEKIAEHLQKQEIQLDGLIHNAGYLINKPFAELTDDDWKEILDVNLMGPIRLTRKLTGLLKKGSHILAISSMGGYQGSRKFPGLAAYSTAKGALNILTECLAAELADKAICANSLCLGMVQTEMLQEAFPGVNAPVTAEEMGDYVADFVLNGHRFYNGKILPVALSDPE